MEAVKITKRRVDSAEPRGTRWTLWDAELRGFGLRIAPSGRKTYALKYRAWRDQRWLTIGRHPDITPDEARRLARAHLGAIATGADPALEKAKAARAETVAQLCAAYLKDAEAGAPLGKRGRAKKDSTLATDRGRIERHIVPLLGRRRVDSLTPPDIVRFIADVSAGKTATVAKTGLRGKAVVTGGTGTAARTVGLLGAILAYAIAQGIIASNPATGVKRPAGETRTRRLTAKDFTALGAALRDAEADGEPWQAVAGVRLLALTGCRRGEIQGLTWDAVDLEGRALRLADSKEGASVRPLGTAAVAVLDALPRNGAFVLTGVRDTTKPYGGLRNGVRRVMARAELAGVGAHTLRHSFASIGGDLGLSPLAIGALLGHAGGSVTSRYVHHLDAVLIEAADHVADAIAEAMRANDDV